MGFISDIVAKGFRGYRGWNNDAAAEADFRATGGAGKWDPGSSAEVTGKPVTNVAQQPTQPDTSALFERALRIQQEAAQPVVSALESQKAAVPSLVASQKSSLEANKQSLKTRYENILSELKRRQGVDTEAVNLAESREFGRRGIPLSSGMFEQNLIQKQRPVNEFYTGQTKDVALEGETAQMELANRILGLPSEEQRQLADLDTAIAQAKAGNSSRAVEILMNMGASQQQAQQFATNQAQGASEFERKLKEEQRQFDATQSRLSSLGTTTGGGGKKQTSGQAAREQLISDLKHASYELPTIMAKYAGQLSPDDIRSLYNLYSPTKYSSRQSTNKLTLADPDEL